MSQAFYRKWRPQKWDEVVAQEHVITTLRNAVRAGRTGHAYLLAGPRGTGKTTTARLLAKSLNCLDPDLANRPCDKCEHCQSLNAGRFLDLIEIDAASNTSVDDVRDLREKINFSPTQGQYKVYIIDEVHMLSTAAFNALLKTLEEPPPHAVFILATTEVHKIPATILSRCQRYEFRRIPVPEIVKYLRKMADEEKLKVDDDALLLIARQATGAMRDAVSLLDQLASTGDRVTLQEAQLVLGTATSNMVIELVEAIITGDAAKGLKLIQSALDAGTDSRQFSRQVVDYLRNLLLVRMGNADQVDATREARDQMVRHAQAMDTHGLLEAIRLFNAAATDTRSGWHPGLALELALTEAMEEKNPPAETGVVQQPQVAQRSERAQTAPHPTRDEQPRQLPRREGGVEEPRYVDEKAQPAAERSQPAADRSQSGAGKSQPVPGKTQPAVEREQPAAEKQPAAQAPAGASGKPVTQHDVQQNWKRIRDFVKKRNSLTEAALNSCRYILKENTLILSFATEVVKSKLESKENLEIIRQALQAVLGTNLNVRCVLANSKSGPSDDSEIDGDGMVGTALDLGGKIVYDE